MDSGIVRKASAMVTIQDELVEFRFFRPGASAVHLVGDFNEWREGDLQMQLTEDGYWTAQMRLASGEYKFQYLADGQWFTDYAAFGIEPGPFGMDSVVRVEHTPIRMPEPQQPIEEVAAA